MRGGVPHSTCPGWCSVAVVNAVIKSNMGREGFISAYMLQFTYG